MSTDLGTTFVMLRLVSVCGSRDCSQCEAGYWGFPQCRACDCNGNAETCDDLTGRCIACLNNTAGDHCERLEENILNLSSVEQVI